MGEGLLYDTGTIIEVSMVFPLSFLSLKIKVLNSESIVIIRIKGEHLLYSKISGG
jgi:hypothetical protein